MSDHAKELEPKIRRIQQCLSKMATENQSDRLLQITRRPGWTTLREVQFVDAMLDSLAHHLEGVDRTHRELVNIADQIGKT